MQNPFVRRHPTFDEVYRSEVERCLAHRTPTPLVKEQDLAPLPGRIVRYLRRVGVVGRPTVSNFRANFRGLLRNGLDAPFMNVRVEQYEFFDPMARLVLIHASRWGVPFQALHAYVGDAATMRVRIASRFDIVDAQGEEMTRSETVTLLNDMCLLAPAALLSPAVSWESTDGGERVTFTHAGHTVAADLRFDSEGDLVDFVSNDRLQSADGKTFRRVPWSTPLCDYRDYGGVRLAEHGDAVWHETTGPVVYARFTLENIEFNVDAFRGIEARAASKSKGRNASNEGTVRAG